MGLWELDYRRRTLIVDLMSESPWLRETETQQDRKDMTSTTTSPSFSKDHSVHLPSSCSSLKYPSLLELPPPIVSSSCTPPSCFGRNETLSFPQTVSSPILDFATSGSPVRERFFFLFSVFLLFSLFLSPCFLQLILIISQRPEFEDYERRKRC